MTDKHKGFKDAIKAYIKEASDKALESDYLGLNRDLDKLAEETSQKMYQLIKVKNELAKRGLLNE